MRDTWFSSIIAYALKHKVLANLLMLVVLSLGVASALRMQRQALPDFTIMTAVVDLRWPTASAADVQESIVTPVENVLFGLEGVLSVRSTASQGRGLVVLEFKNGTDVDKRVQEIRNRIAPLDFPDGVENANVYQPIAKERTLNVLVYGPKDIRQLRRFAIEARRSLMAMGVDDVAIQGVPEQELTIELSQESLHALGLSLDELATQIAQKSTSIPVGSLGQGGQERAVRTEYKLTEAFDYASLYLMNAVGRLFRLGGYADVALESQYAQPLVFYNNQPAVSLRVSRIHGSGNDVFVITDKVRQWMQKMTDKYPGDTVNFLLYAEGWKLVKQRIELILKNGSFGFIFIFCILVVFLQLRIAFWVAMGVPIAVSGALALMASQGGSINFLSTFGFLMAFGIIVDDTIVVSEQAYREFQKGSSPYQAVYRATCMMFSPIMASSLTTVAAFMPLLIMQGLFGKILKDIPFVVIVVIIASLLECFIILPHHLQSALSTMPKKPQGLRKRWDAAMQWVQFTLFRRWVKAAVSNAWVTLSVSFCLIALPFVLVLSGRIGFDFFPSPPNDIVFMDADFFPGTADSSLKAFLDKANTSLFEVDAKLSGDTLSVRVPVQLLSYKTPEGGSLRVGSDYEQGHAAMLVGLTPPDKRQVSNTALLDAWRNALLDNKPVGLTNLSVSEPKAGPPGSDIRLLVKGPNTLTIKAASEALKSRLSRFELLVGIKDSLVYGKPEYVVTLKPLAKSLGMSKAWIARQLASGLYGSKVQENADFGETVRVMVRLKRQEQLTQDVLHSFPIQTPTGQTVALGELAEARLERSFVSFQNYNGKQYSEVSANITEGDRLDQVLKVIKNEVVPEIERAYGVEITDEEQARYENEALVELRYGAVLGLLMIYLVLAWVSRSYGWPAVVMLVIPFGLSGALLGHYVLGMPMTLLSLFGLFGLTGIIVNNAIILLHRFQALVDEGKLSAADAIIEASCQRVRAVFLTTITTISGLVPLLLETSLQAQFLQPMAVSISFGLGVSTVLILLVLPTVMGLFLTDNS